MKRISPVLLICGLFLITCAFKQASKKLSPIHLKLKLISKGFTSPVGMASPEDGSQRMFVIEQGGKIKIIKNGELLSDPFIDVSKKLDGLNIGYSEKGLLGLAFDPGYKSNGFFYVYYSAKFDNKDFDHKSMVARYKVSATNADVADALSEEVLLEIPEPESNHNGGCLQFGKDGYLYIGVGDGGGAGDEHGTIGNGQNLNTLLGKILRIDVHGKKPYDIPTDNPFVNKAGCKAEIFAYGLRNPWRFSFDRATGLLYCADVGQNKWEEVNIIEKGKNYGWRIMEGYHCFNPANGCKTDGLTLPIDEYSHNDRVSVCGGYMYRGKMFPSLQNYYLFGDWSGKLFYLKKDKDAGWQRGEIFTDDNTNNDMGAKINSMGQDENGEVYLITQHLFGPKSPTGAVYRLGF